MTPSCPFSLRGVHNGLGLGAVYSLHARRVCHRRRSPFKPCKYSLIVIINTNFVISGPSRCRSSPFKPCKYSLIVIINTNFVISGPSRCRSSPFKPCKYSLIVIINTNFVISGPSRCRSSPFKPCKYSLIVIINTNFVISGPSRCRSSLVSSSSSLYVSFCFMFHSILGLSEIELAIQSLTPCPTFFYFTFFAK
jgi:hypothetical protein